MALVRLPQALQSEPGADIVEEARARQDALYNRNVEVTARLFFSCVSCQ